MDMPPPEALEPFLPSIVDGTLSEQQRQQLAEILNSDEECQLYYVKYVRVIAMLEFMHGGLSGGLSSVVWESELANQKSLIQEVFEEEEQARQELEKQQALADLLADKPLRKSSKPTFRGSLYDIVPAHVLVVGLAASLLIVGLMLLSPHDPQDPNIANGGQNSSETGIAKLTAQHDAKWERGGAEIQLTSGDSLEVGQLLRLTEGFAEVTTERGAVAILEAPVSVEILDSPNAIGLHSGKLVGLCHTVASHGFIVVTEHANITDLGTEFGVEVAGTSVTATVFTGEINFTPPGGQPQIVTAHQTARLQVDVNDRAMVVEDQIAEGFTTRLPRQPLVSSAKLNVKGFEVRVVPQGVREDALLYTDRQHEINGVDQQGIPPVLLGGDLIMMPALARPERTPGIKPIQLELEFTRAADLYVLFPSQSKPTSWLTRDYADTRMAAGQDLSGGDANETAGIGAGQSIDGTFSVWKRKQVALGKVSAAGKIDGSMYVLIAVPRDG